MTFKQTVKRLSVFMILAVLFCITNISNPAFALTPQGLYDKAWRLINSKYVDETQNQQNWNRWRHKYDNVIVDEEDAYVVLPNDYTAKQLGDVALDISNYKITSWLGSDSNDEYTNIINFEDDNHWYKISEYPDVESTDEVVEVFTDNDNYTAENYELNGIEGMLIYADSTPEHFAFQSGDYVYLITFYDAEISDVTFVQAK